MPTAETIIVLAPPPLTWLPTDQGSAPGQRCSQENPSLLGGTHTPRPSMRPSASPSVTSTSLPEWGTPGEGGGGEGGGHCVCSTEQQSMRPSASPSATSTSFPEWGVGTMLGRYCDCGAYQSCCVYIDSSVNAAKLDRGVTGPSTLPPPFLLTVDDPRPVFLAVHVLPEHTRYAGM